MSEMREIAKAETLQGALLLLEACDASMQAKFTLTQRGCEQTIFLRWTSRGGEAEFQRYAAEGRDNIQDYDNLVYRSSFDGVKEFVKEYLRLFAKISERVDARILTETDDF